MRCLLIVVCLLGLIHAEETVYLRSGQFQKGTLISQSKEAITFEFKKSGVTGLSRVRIPWKSIERIQFASPVAQIEALANPGKAELSVLAELWGKAAPWISRPDSKAAEIGLIYAKRLADSGEEMAPEQALDLFDLISKTAWKPADQAAAIRGRLNTLLRAGKEREAIREAEALAAATENPTLLLEAKQVLAANAFEKLKAIEEENPRWELDDEVRPGRNQYFNTAIDHSLFAYLFYGTKEAAAAKGLLQAAELYHFAKDLKNAKLCAEDIVKLYPDTEFVEEAKLLLSRIPSQPTE